MATTDTANSTCIREIARRDGITTCAYFNGDQNQPFVCPDNYSCTLYPFGAWWGCVNAVNDTLADHCFNADNSQPDRHDALNCPPSAPYCNTLYLKSGVVTMSTWTCGSAAGIKTLLNTYTGSGIPTSTTKSTASSTLSGVSSTTMTATYSTSAYSSSLSPTSTTSPQSSGTSPGGLVGILVGSIIGGAFLIFVAFLAYKFNQRLARRREQFDRQQAERARMMGSHT